AADAGHARDHRLHGHRPLGLQVGFGRGDEGRQRRLEIRAVREAPPPRCARPPSRGGNACGPAEPDPRHFWMARPTWGALGLRGGSAWRFFDLKAMDMTGDRKPWI